MKIVIALPLIIASLVWKSTSTSPVKIVLALPLIIAAVWASVRTFQKAGYSGWLAVLYFIPVVNFLTIVWFAAAEWPIEAELRRLRTAAPKPGSDADPSEGDAATVPLFDAPEGADASPSDVEASALYHEAIGLEVTGRAVEALAKYQQTIDDFPKTTEAQEAQKRIEALRKKQS